MYQFNDPNFKHLRREVRKRATPAEKLLWEQLRNRRLQGVKFRRGYQIGRYYADFYAPEKRLVIEVDGAIHNLPDQVEYDSIRENEMKAMGICIIRFTNEEIFHQMPKVLSVIESSL